MSINYERQSTGDSWTPEEDAKLKRLWEELVIQMRPRSEAAVAARVNRNRLAWRRGTM